MICDQIHLGNVMPPLEIIKSEANKPNVNSAFPKHTWLRSPLLSASLVAHLGWINRKALRQPLSVASLTSRLLSSVCSRAWCYISWQRLEGSFYIHQGSGAEQRAPLSLQRDAPRFGVKARTKIPLRRPHWVCSIWQTGNGGPRVLLDVTQTVLPAWISSKADGTHACLSHKEISIKYPQDIWL